MPQVKPRVPIRQLNHPLWRGCRLYLPFSEGAGPPRDLAGGDPPTPGAGLTWQGGPYGPEQAGNGTHWLAFAAADRGFAASNAATVAAFVVRNSTYTGIFEQAAASGSVNTGFSLLFEGANLAWRCHAGGRTGGADILYALSTGVIGVAVGIYDTAGGQHLYWNGALVASSAIKTGNWNSPPVGPATAMALRETYYPFAAADRLRALAAWDRALSAGEARALTAGWLSGERPMERSATRLIVPLTLAGGPAFLPSWAAYSNQIIGMGAVQ